MSTTTSQDAPSSNTDNSSSFSSKLETTNNDNDKDALLSWDDICMNPFDESVEKGREEGAKAGLEAGYNEGYYLGKMKGIEIGFELGFIRGFATIVRNQIIPSMETKQEQDTSQTSRLERIQKRLEELDKALREFPSSEELFSISQQKSTIKGEKQLGGDQQATIQEEESNSSTAIDVTAQLQSVRSKFKLITVLLKMPHLNLKNFLKDNAPETLKSIPETNNNNEPNNAEDSKDSKDHTTKTNSVSMSSDW